MYFYKLNNSYTIYVNYAYLNECRKASKNFSNSSLSKKSTLKQKNIEQKKVHAFAENTLIYHKVFGCGKVSDSKEEGYISIVFGDRVRKFLYPQAFDLGYLTRN